MARWLAIAVFLLAGACKEAPTSILLTVEAVPGLEAPEELRLSVFTEAGVVVKERRLPEAGPPALPGQVALFPAADSGKVRMLVRALVAQSPIGEGVATVEIRSNEQVPTTLTIRAGALPDADGDGVPDQIDNCPLPNPDQSPCPTEDGGLQDGGPDSAILEFGPDIECDRDDDQHLSRACGGLDCDDDDPAVHPGSKEGPVSSQTCQDGKDNDCDGTTDTQDKSCQSCTTDADCDDGNECTDDLCKGAGCSNAPTSEGQSCADGDKCTAGTACTSGLCAGGNAVICPPPSSPCKDAVCDPVTGCGARNKPDGDPCDDSKWCTTADSCLAGICGGNPRDCQSSAPQCQTGSCDEASDSCEFDPVTDGSACDDLDPCTQGESCQSGTCADPGVQLEDVVQHNIALRSDRSLAIDSKGYLHTVYWQEGALDLRYATNATGSWTTERLGPAAGDIGKWAAIAIDAQDTIYVILDDEPLNKAVIASRASGATSWTYDFVRDGDGHGSIAVDGTGNVHASVQDDGDLFYVSGVAGQWTNSQVDTPPTGSTDGVGFHSSLAVDSSGAVHIAHGRGQVDDSAGYPLYQIEALRYSTNKGGSWSTVEPATLTSDHGGYASIAVGSSGVHISHTDTTTWASTSGTLWITSLASGTWSTTTFGSGGKQSGAYSSILLDSQGNIHVAYRDPATSMLMHATNAGSSAWVLTPLASHGSGTNGWAGIAQQSSGTLHVTFEQANSKLRHASLSACP